MGRGEGWLQCSFWAVGLTCTQSTPSAKRDGVFISMDCACAPLSTGALPLTHG